MPGKLGKNHIKEFKDSGDNFQLDCSEEVQIGYRENPYVSCILVHCITLFLTEIGRDSEDKEHLI